MGPSNLQLRPLHHRSVMSDDRRKLCVCSARLRLAGVDGELSLRNPGCLVSLGVGPLAYFPDSLMRKSLGFALDSDFVIGSETGFELGLRFRWGFLNPNCQDPPFRGLCLRDHLFFFVRILYSALESQTVAEIAAPRHYS